MEWVLKSAFSKLSPLARSASESTFSRALFLRGLALVHLIALLSWWSQAILLTGEDGLLPASDFLEQAGSALDSAGKGRWTALPTLFWITGASDAAIHALCAVGCALALMAIVGWLPGPVLAGLWAISLSLVNTGGVFLSYQWDILLLESGFLAIFIAPWGLRLAWRNPPAPGPLARAGTVLAWLLVAKLMFLSGWVKLAWATPEAPEWWPERSAMTFHYMTQPLPTWTAWWMHQLPEAWHRFSVWPVYAIEMGLPVLVLCGRWGRLVAAVGFAGLMLLIAATGNYTYFNLLTAVLCLPLVADRFWPRAFLLRWLRVKVRLGGKRRAAGTWAGEKAARPGRIGRLWWKGRPLLASPAWVLLAGLALLNAQVWLRDLHRAPNPVLERDFSPAWLDGLAERAAPFHLASGYGLFRTMTTDRPEIILEGSRDGRRWFAYNFRWKVDAVEERPAFVAPHQPRVAWQLWFAALERRFHPQSRNARWFEALLGKLLRGDEEVQAIFERNPFPDEPPDFLRARLYLYEFTDREERRRSGDWWKRRVAGEYLPAVSLK